MVELNKTGQRDPLAWVIAFDEGDGKTSYHGCSMFDGQAALRYYPSPFDALVDISRNPELSGAKRGFSVRAVEALRISDATASGYASVIASMPPSTTRNSGSGILCLRPRS
ncbi:hypothetical protein [Paraburkholderia sp. J63]|uniref:hypothetical protein n=1 Tax=Paraburkholderia sp. J63 TaxID=2805434 RepID=UPI002ABE677B|nr:hypothetical protein [Paraburkholderia sp. J63]